MMWIVEQRALILNDYHLTDQETRDLLEVFDMITTDMVESYPTIKLVPKTGGSKLLKTLATNVTTGTLMLQPPPFIQQNATSESWRSWLALGLLLVGVAYAAKRFQ